VKKSKFYSVIKFDQSDIVLYFQRQHMRTNDASRFDITTERL